MYKLHTLKLLILVLVNLYLMKYVPSIAIKSGVVIACFVDEYEDEEPQLGRVTEDLGAEDVEVEWMVGAYLKP